MGQTVGNVGGSNNGGSMLQKRWQQEDAPKLVLSYLIYHCHQHAAATFLREWLGDDNHVISSITSSHEWRSLDYRSSTHTITPLKLIIA
jgi:hypothetical protein